MTEKACLKCKRIVTGRQCPICKTSKLSTKWKGLIVILDAKDSKIAEEMGVTEGRYALKVK